jgi:hypothetical protein
MKCIVILVKTANLSDSSVPPHLYHQTYKKHLESKGGWWYALLMNRTFPKQDTSSEEALELLHQDGWSLGHTAEDGVWLVLGKKGSKVIRASGGTLEEAWLNALEQARLSVEMN